MEKGTELKGILGHINKDTTKGLEALEALERMSGATLEEDLSVKDIYYDEYHNIKQALQRLESTENSEPSEALECLEDIEADLTGLPKHVTEYDDGFDSYLEDIWDRVDTIKQALLKAQSQNMKYNEINKTFNDSHICEIKKEFAKYIPLCEESKCDECPLGVGDGICLKNVFEKKWELQIKAQEQEKVQKVIFEKNVNIFWLKECKSLEEYNYNIADYMKLTEEEFNSLKEMVKRYEKR